MIHKPTIIFAVLLGLALCLACAGCAPLRDQNGNPVPDKQGNEQFHKAL